MKKFMEKLRQEFYGWNRVDTRVTVGMAAILLYGLGDAYLKHHHEGATLTSAIVDFALQGFK